MMQDLHGLNELYQEVIIDHQKNPHNFKKIESATRVGEGYNPLCGDKVKLYMTMSDGVIKDIGFQGAGCALSTASASLMTDAVKGKTRADIEKVFEKFHKLITGGHEAEPDCVGLGKLTVFAGISEFPVRVKCVSLAWHTLRAALEEKKEPVSTE